MDLHRAAILRFNTELIRGLKHTEEDFNEIMHNITCYERYCDAHPEYPNPRIDLDLGKLDKAGKNEQRAEPPREDFFQLSQQVSKVYALEGKGELDGLDAVSLVQTDAGQVLRSQNEVQSILFVIGAEQGAVDDATAAEHPDPRRAIPLRDRPLGPTCSWPGRASSRLAICARAHSRAQAHGRGL